MPPRLVPSLLLKASSEAGRRSIACRLAAFILLACAQGAQAELPSIRLSTVFPPGGQTGGRFEVGVTGADLDGADQIRFSHPGISSTPKTNAANGAPEANRFLISISSDVPPGVYEARVSGRFGVSNPRAFSVDQSPELTAPSTNTSTASATLVPLGCIINGHSEPNASSFFKFNARKGQRVFIECKAREIDSRMDPAMVLTDAAGKELLRERTGGSLDFAAPADGEYRLRLYDALFRGGGEYFYRLALRTGPHIEFIFPPAGLAGAKSRFSVYGWNLPGGVPDKDSVTHGTPLERLDVEIEPPSPAQGRQAFTSLKSPADAVLDAFEYRLASPEGPSNPVMISFASGPVVAEQEPNDRPDQAQRISPPCEYAGRFHPRGDRDWVVFDARKGDVFWVEVYSQRLGLPTDPFVLIQRVSKNAKGEEQVSDVKELYDTEANIGGMEHKTSSRDPAGRFEADADGAYRIQVRDMFNTSKADLRLFYRLSIRKESPDFRLLSVAQPPPPLNKDSRELLVSVPFIRRGETIPLKVMAIRRDGFNGDIELQVDGLPPGVSCGGAVIEKDKTSTLLFLTATENAGNWAGPIHVKGKARIGGAEVVREAAGSTVEWAIPDYNNESVRSRLSRDFQLGVSGVESAPISVEPVGGKVWEATVGGKLKIPLAIIRRGDFGANLKFKAIGAPELEKLKELEVDGKATNAVLEVDLAEHKLAAGNHRLNLQTQTAGKYRNNPEAAKEADDALKQIEKTIAELNLGIKAAPGVKAAAVKAAAQSTAKAAEAAEAFASASKQASETEALAKAAEEAVAATKPGLDGNPEDTELLAQREYLLKPAEAARQAAKAALESRLSGEKSLAEARRIASADQAALKAAEQFEAEAPARLKAAEMRREPAANRAKETAKVAEPRDVNITVYSAPIMLKVTPPAATAAK